MRNVSSSAAAIISIVGIALLFVPGGPTPAAGQPAASVFSIPTLASIQKGSFTQPLLLLGGYTKAGKGGGLLYYDADDKLSPTDHCRVFVDAAGHRFKRSFGFAVSAFDCGAIGDGVADDTSALTRFLQYLSRNSGEGLIPKGIYRTTTKLTIPANVSLRGEGNAYDSGCTGTGFKPANSVGRVAIELAGTSSVLSNFCVDGTLTSNAVGLRIANGGIGSELAMTNVSVWNFQGAGGVGIQIRELVRANFRHLYLSKSGRNLEILGGGRTPPASLAFYDTVFHESTNGPGVRIETGFQVSFWNCTSEANAEAGYSIYAPPGRTISQVYFYGGWLEANWQSVPVGPVRQSRYQIDADGSGVGSNVQNIGVQDTYFNGSTGHASAAKFNKVYNIRLNGPVTQLLPNAIAIMHPASTGWITQWQGYPRAYVSASQNISIFSGGVECSPISRSPVSNLAGLVTRC